MLAGHLTKFKFNDATDDAAIQRVVQAAWAAGAAVHVAGTEVTVLCEESSRSTVLTKMAEAVADPDAEPEPEPAPNP